MKKVLFVASVVKKHIMVFHLPYLKHLQEKGYVVHVCASNDYDDGVEFNIPHCDKYFDIPFERSPIKSKNILAYNQLKKIINDNQYDIIHCHTPIGGVIGRLAARKSKAKIIYTAHGFHFFNGASLKNWLFYYNIEKFMSKYTDLLITINKEDYNIAIEKNFKAKEIILVNGVGINLDKFKPIEEKKKIELREKNGYKSDDFILIYVGELSYRKHQDLIINASHILKSKILNLKVLFVGSGDYEIKYKNLVKKLNLEDHIEFLGFRKDIKDLMSISDIAISSSRQEGLPVNIMEAMATSLPIVATDCRGNRDLVKDNVNGYIVGIEDISALSTSIEKLYYSEELRNTFGRANLKFVEKYKLETILDEMDSIYCD